MVIGISHFRKENGREEGRGLVRAVRPADQANCSKRLLRRSGFFDSRSSGIASRSSSIAGRSSGIAGRSSGIAGRIASRSSRISGRINRRHHFGGSRRSVFSRCFFLGTGAQHEGNRNGAPDLCIHRQSPQYVQSEKEGEFRGENIVMTRFHALPRRPILPL
jgi:hypothetical protein